MDWLWEFFTETVAAHPEITIACALAAVIIVTLGIVDYRLNRGD